MSACLPSGKGVASLAVTLVEVLRRWMVVALWLW
jgi:hypothetical protein